MLQVYARNRQGAQKVWMGGYLGYILFSLTLGLRPRKRKARAPSTSAPVGGDAAADKDKQAVEADMAASGKGKGRRGGRRRGPRVEVDAVFFDKLNRILSIVVPGMKSKEASLLILHSGFLILRTLLSVVRRPLSLIGVMARSPRPAVRGRSRR